MSPRLGQREFDSRFEALLVFLVEAIGVPVLLSLLLLAFSDTSDDVLDLDGLPADRLQVMCMARSHVHPMHTCTCASG